MSIDLSQIIPKFFKRNLNQIMDMAKLYYTLACLDETSRSLNGPLPRFARRLLKQQSTEPPRGEAQQEQHREPEQHYRFPRGQYDNLHHNLSPHWRQGPEGARAGKITVFPGVYLSSRAVHDDHGRGKWFAPVTATAPVLGDAWAPAGAVVLFPSSFPRPRE
jgi:hypothetical protein